MDAQMEEAVSHESERIRKWGCSREGEGFMAKPGLVQKLNFACDLLGVGGHVAGHFHRSHHAKNQDDSHEEST